MALNDNVPSEAFDVLVRNMQDLDKIVNSVATSIDLRGAPNGKTNSSTITGLEQRYIQTPLNGGVWAAGIDFESYNQYMIFSGVAYRPKAATTLPYTSTASPDTAFVEPFNDLVTSDLSTYTDLVFDDVASAQASAIVQIGNKIRIVSRGNSDFLVTSDTPNGYDKIDLGDSLTATLILTPSTPVSAYGATGVSDGTDALQAAIDNGNGLIIVDDNVNYTTVTVTENLRIIGLSSTGGDTTNLPRLNQIDATLDGIVSTGSRKSLQIESVHLTASVTKTSGTFVKFTSNQNSIVTNCTFSEHYRGVSFDDVFLGAVRNCIFTDAVEDVVTTGSAHIVLSESQRSDTVIIKDNVSFLTDKVNQPTYGVLVKYQDVLFAESNNFVQSGTIFSITPDNGQTASLIFINSGSFDSSEYGVVIAPAVGGEVTRVSIALEWLGVMSQDGIRIDGSNGDVKSILIHDEIIITGITCTGITCFGNNVNDLQIDNANVSDSNIGIRVVDTATRLRISNSVIGDVSGANPNVDGVVIGSSVTGTLNCNDFSGNSGTNISNNSANVTEFGNIPYTWSTYTPSVSATSGTINTVTATGRYRIEGGIAHIQVSLTIDDNGTGSGGVQFSLPVDTSANASVITGRANNLSGLILQSILSGSNGTCYNSTGGYPAVTGEILIISGSYEI